MKGKACQWCGVVSYRLSDDDCPDRPCWDRLLKWVDHLTSGQRYVLGILLGAALVGLAWAIRKGLDFWEGEG